MNDGCALRQRVLRRLLERPSLLYADLDEEERSWVQRNLGSAWPTTSSGSPGCSSNDAGKAWR